MDIRLEVYIGGKFIKYIKIFIRYAKKCKISDADFS